MSNPRNNLTLWAGVVADPEVKDLNSGGKVVEFRLALDYAMRDSIEPDNTTAFVSAIMYDNGNRDTDFVFKQIADGNLKKGSQVAVTGELRLNKFKNKDEQVVEKVVLQLSGLAYQRSGEKKASTDGNTSDAGDAPGSVINKF